MASWASIVKTYLGSVLLVAFGVIIYTILGEESWGTSVVALGIGSLLDLTGQSGRVPVVRPEP